MRFNFYVSSRCSVASPHGMVARCIVAGKYEKINWMFLCTQFTYHVRWMIVRREKINSTSHSVVNENILSFSSLLGRKVKAQHEFFIRKAVFLCFFHFLFSFIPYTTSFISLFFVDRDNHRTNTNCTKKWDGRKAIVFH